ncbi:hypothetical protein ACGF8B_37915 [Streptomyces sp. NPDC047917]|uniref:hypothetical protein n=1 Tax=Streptomyces sp. NPDC047917 TaxID=3365491 RepID=UPI00371B90C8
MLLSWPADDQTQVEDLAGRVGGRVVDDDVGRVVAGAEGTRAKLKHRVKLGFLTEADIGSFIGKQ